MAGPWFTVQPSSDDWRRFGELWISNGARDLKGRVEVQLRFATPEEVEAHD